MSKRPGTFSNLIRSLRYGKQVIALGDEIAAARIQLSCSVRLLEGSAEAKELDETRTRLLQVVKDFPRLTKLRQYLFQVHDLPPELDFLPPCLSHKPEPPIAVLCPACGRTVLISVGIGMWDGTLADGRGASGIFQFGTCTECGSKMGRSKTTIPIRQEEWGSWHKESN